MNWNDAIDLVQAIHLEDGDLLVLLGKHAARLGTAAVPLLAARGLAHCMVLTADKRDLDVRALNREQMREAGWVRIEEAEALGVAGAPIEELTQFLIDPDDPDSATAHAPRMHYGPPL